MTATPQPGLDAMRLRTEARATCEADIVHLQAIEVAARRYFLRYVQDEADAPELGVPGQHEDAVALKEALGL